ncbi:MAG: hydroxyacid dehydrogenase [Spirochaetales bacterium]|nr:hydroxyacid dehydrogenase [Spirochaetales bacterium]
MFRILTEVGAVTGEMLKDFPGMEIEQKGPRNRDEVLKIIAGFHGLIAGATFDFNKEFFEAATGLKVISRFGAGVDNVDIDAATKHGVWVTNTPGANAVTVAEHTVGLMICVMKRMALADRIVKDGGWPAGKLGVAFELTGKVHGQVGFGQIGANVARMTRRAFNMDVLVYDPFVSEDVIKEQVSGKKVDLDTLLEKSDVVTLNLPNNEETQGLFNYERLKKMKKTAILVNTARGGVVVEEDLIRFVKEDGLYGVGLDVTVDEPIKPGNPLLKLDKVTLTGHTAASSVEFIQRASRWILEDQQLVAAGKKPKYARNSIS